MRLLAMVSSLLVLVACGPSAKDRDDAGRACFDKKDLPCAIREFSLAVKAAPHTAHYRYNLALALAKARVLEQARTEAQAAVTLDPADLRARELLGRIDHAIASRNASLVSFD
jgi:Flp pilus assembly protein TadD